MNLRVPPLCHLILGLPLVLRALVYPALALLTTAIPTLRPHQRILPKSIPQPNDKPQPNRPRRKANRELMPCAPHTARDHARKGTTDKISRTRNPAINPLQAQLIHALHLLDRAPRLPRPAENIQTLLHDEEYCAPRRDFAPFA